MIAYLICLFLYIRVNWVPLDPRYKALVQEAAANFLIIDLIAMIAGLFFHPMEIQFNWILGVSDGFPDTVPGVATSFIIQFFMINNAVNLWEKWVKLKGSIRKK